MLQDRGPTIGCRVKETSGHLQELNVYYRKTTPLFNQLKSGSLHIPKRTSTERYDLLKINTFFVGQSL